MMPLARAGFLSLILFSRVADQHLWNTFQQAKLQEADLQDAKLGGAKLQRANLQGTTLQGADLTEAKNLTPDQVKTACGDQNTQLPAYLEGLTPPPCPE